MSVASGKSKGSRSECPDIPSELNLGALYKGHRCRFCGVWSCGICTWDTRDTVLQSWYPVWPWQRGTKLKPSGEVCKVCAVVWDQGGFEAKFKTVDKFNRACEADPTVGHKFQDIRAGILKMKAQNPNMKFRVEMNIGCLETITTNEKSSQGLKANKSFFVELDAYRMEYGEPEPHEVTSDYLPSGAKVLGVNVSLGKAGWWKRIDKRTNQVKREAQLTEESAVDPTGEALDNIQSAAKRAVLRDIRPVRYDEAPMVGLPSSSSGVSKRNAVDETKSGTNTGSDKDKDGENSGSGSESEDNTGGIRMMKFLNRYSAPSNSPQKAAPKGKAKAKAASSHVKQQARTSTSAAKPKTSAAKNKEKETESKPRKTVVGNAGKRKANAADLDFNLDDDDDTALSKSDLAILDSFNEKLEPLRDISAPMADKEFRSKLAEHQSELSAFKADLKLKMKSLNRRVCNSEEVPPVNQELGKIEELVKSMSGVIKCLLGQTTVDSNTSMLAYLDDAASKYNMTFSASIIRRALKMMIFEDIKLLEFDRIMMSTRDTVNERFENDSENPKETAEDFFATTIAQSLQKLVKSVIAQKKDAQPSTDKLTKFLDAIYVSSVTNLANEAGTILDLIRKDSTPLSKLKAALEHMSQVSKSAKTGCSSQLCAVVMATTFGGKIVAEAKVALDSRGSEEELHTSVASTFDPLKAMISEGQLKSSEDLSKWCQSIVDGAEFLQKIRSSRQQVKVLGKEAVDGFATIVRKSVAIVVWYVCQTEVTPWVDQSIESMKTQRCFKEPEVVKDDMAKLTRLDQCKAFQDLLSQASVVSKETIGMKSGVIVAQGDKLHTMLTGLAKAICDFEEFLKISKPIVTEDEIGAFFKCIHALMAELRILRDGVTEKDGDVAKVFLLESLGRLQEPLKDCKLNFEEIGKYTERLSLLAAALPPEGERRKVQLESSEFLQTFFGLVQATQGHLLAEDVIHGDLVKTLKACIASFEKYENIEQIAIGVLKTLHNKTMELPMDATGFGKICAQLREDAAKSLHTWTSQKALDLDAAVGCVLDLKLPDTSSLSYAGSDDQTMPKLDKDFPELIEFQDRVPELSGYANKLHTVMNEIKDANCQSEITKYDQAVAVMTNLLSVIATMVLVRILSAKRFVKAIESNAAIPSKLANELGETLTTCKEHTLVIPAALQAKAAQYSVAAKDKSES